MGGRVKAGEKIGILGAGFTAETENERRHLHFGLYRGSGVNISCYTKNRVELTQWYDPADFFERFDAVLKN